MHLFVPEDNFIFMHVPKCAGTSVLNLFMNIHPDKKKVRQISYGINVPLKNNHTTSYNTDYSVKGGISIYDTRPDRPIQRSAYVRRNQKSHQPNHNSKSDKWIEFKLPMIKSADTMKKAFPDIDKHNTYAIIRNPWDRAVSMWSFITTGGGTSTRVKDKTTPWITFEEFLDPEKGLQRGKNKFWITNHKTEEIQVLLEFRNQIDFIFPNTKLLRYENLTSDWEKYINKPYGYGSLNNYYTNISDHRGIPKPASRHKLDYKQYYGTGRKEAILRSRVAEIWKEDIEKFGYKY